MKVIRGIGNIKQQFSQCVLTMGNFDGVHIGHQALISRLLQVGKARQVPTVVMVFEPQPLEFFSPERAPARLTAFQEKYEQLAQLGVDYLLAIPFNPSVAKIPAKAFITEWLLKYLHVQAVIVGEDFQFGAQRQGNVEFLSQLAEPLGFSVEIVYDRCLSGTRVSSTAVRQALQRSDFLFAQQLLGRPYTIEGKVIHGNALARQLGFPTANVHLHRKKPALQGVYLVKVTHLCRGQRDWGVANIGFRPTVEGTKAILEVNIFDFTADIYGTYLAIEFVSKLRDEQKFDSLEALKAQITRDVTQAKQEKVKFS